MNPRARKRTTGPTLGLLAMILLLAPACGTQEDFAPVLTGFSKPLNPWSVRAGYGDGELSLGWTVDFQDPDGDVVLLHVRWQDCGTEDARALDVLKDNLRNLTSGSIPFTIVIRTDCPVGDYAAGVSVSDGQGNQSNTLKALYEIYVLE